MEQYINDIQTMTTIKFAGEPDEFEKLIRLQPQFKKKFEARALYHITDAFSISNLVRQVSGKPVTNDSVEDKITALLNEEAIPLSTEYKLVNKKSSKIEYEGSKKRMLQQMKKLPKGDFFLVYAHTKKIGDTWSSGVNEEAREKMHTTLKVPSASAKEIAKSVRESGYPIMKSYSERAGEIAVFVVAAPLAKVQQWMTQINPKIYPEIVWENQMTNIETKISNHLSEKIKFGSEDERDDYGDQAHEHRKDKEHEKKMDKHDVSKDAEKKAREAGHAAAKKIHGKDYSKEEADKHIDKIISKYAHKHDPKDHGDLVAIVVHSFRHDPAHKDESIESRLDSYLNEGGGKWTFNMKSKNQNIEDAFKKFHLQFVKGEDGSYTISGEFKTIQKFFKDQNLNPSDYDIKKKTKPE